MKDTKMANDGKRISRLNLVFPPYISPSCVPIGIASLKSYIEEKARDAQVKTVDLSIDFINKVVEGKTEKICNTCTMKDGLGQKLFIQEIPQQYVELFKAARSLIKDKNQFYNKKLFVQRIQPLHIFLTKYFSCFSLILRHYLEGRIIDVTSVFNLVKDEVRQSVEGKPDLVGFSALAYTQINFSIALAKMVKEEYGIPVILGGPAFFNLDLKELMEAFEFIDFIIVKEGEEALLGLIRALNREIDYEDVPNLIWRKEGKIVFNEEKIISNLDELPTPDFSDLRLNEYYFPELILPISSARDCPWNLCKFCQLNAQYGGRYRQRSIEKVINDIKILTERHNVRNFFLTDSEVTAGRLKEIGNALLKETPHVYFGCYARPTNSLNMEVLEAAYKGGCRLLQLGVESLSDKYLEFVHKGTSRESILNVLRNADEVGIKLICYMLCGIPNQTGQELLLDMREVAALQKRYNIFSVMYSLYSLGKYQHFCIERDKYGIEVTGRRIAFSNTNHKIVHIDETLEYRYKDNSAYSLLKDCDHTEVDSSLMAVVQITNMTREFGINGENSQFINTINGFLFETQLLHSKTASIPQV